VNRGSTAVGAVLLGAVLTACGGSNPATLPAPAPSLPVAASHSITTSDVSYWPYDYGYGYGQLSATTGTGSTCEDGASALIASGTLANQTEVDGHLTGCSDAQAGKLPSYSPPPPQAQPFPAPTKRWNEDPCLTGVPGPWGVLWATPSQSGNITVGARCEKEAKREARKQLPADAIIVDVFSL
jgi:hypothetical protein